MNFQIQTVIAGCLFAPITILKYFAGSVLLPIFSFKCCIKISNKKFKPDLLLMILQQWIGNKMKITAVNKE